MRFMVWGGDKVRKSKKSVDELLFEEFLELHPEYKRVFHVSIFLAVLVAIAIIFEAYRFSFSLEGDKAFATGLLVGVVLFSILPKLFGKLYVKITKAEKAYDEFIERQYPCLKDLER